MVDMKWDREIGMKTGEVENGRAIRITRKYSD